MSTSPVYIAVNSVQSVVGTVTPPPGVPQVTLGGIVSWAILSFILIMGLLTLYYFLMGAFDWVNSQGQEDKIESARSKITNAAIGLVLVIVLLVVWGVLTTIVFPVVCTGSGGAFSFALPTIDGSMAGCK